MSTDPQLLGDSRRRQLHASRAYAEAHGLELAEGAELEDIGISAFKGANVSEGALGKFLEAVKSGSVKPGSYLLVESLDRLSRQEILPSQALFLSIVQAGIHLVTLADGRVYRAGTNDLGDLIVSLVIMSRAHEESQTKSHRISAAWKNKRILAADLKPMTKWCPAWLELLPDRSKFIAIPERADIVRGMFNDAIAGIGIYSIARRLNEKNVPTFGSPNGWHPSYVAKILANRAVLGEGQPYAGAGSKRAPQGNAIKTYYPQIISDELFYQAQFAKSQRRGSGAGRKGSGFTNLFSGIASCAYCRSPILLENKGAGPKGGTYLLCDGVKRHLGCVGLRWRYQDFEASFIAFVEELDIDSLVNESSKKGQQQNQSTELAALQGELSAVTDLMEKTYAILSGGGPVEFVTGKLNELNLRREDLRVRVKSIDEERERLASQEARYRQSKEEIKQLVSRLQSPATDELFKLRAQVASQLKSLIGTLLIGSVGEGPRMRDAIDRARKELGLEAGDVIAHMERLAAHPNQTRRFFAVGFRDGNVRVVFPAKDDPLRYEQQVVAQSGGLDFIEPDGSLRLG
jgi:DNA invertase Pin-like site-specific DNA recombinase